MSAAAPRWGAVPSLELPDWVPDLPTIDWPAPPDLPGLDPAQYLVLVPAVAAVLALVLVRRSSRAVAWLVVPAWLLTLGVALFVAYGWLLGTPPGADGVAGVVRSGTVPPPDLGELQVPLELAVDRVGVLLAVVVALITLCVQVYARWFLWFDPRYRQFAATTSLFGAAMLLVVLSGDLLLVLVGWGLMGWCSYLLIGHASTREAANRAAGKALVTTRLADVGFVVGVLVLVAGAGTSDLARVVTHWSGAGGASDPTLLTLALLGLVVGVAGRSAQIPFQDWLPDAVHGPTPASALIQTATMVAAGTVVLVRVLPLLAGDDIARTTLAVIACTTTVVAAVLAFAQPDLTRVLAWSTVSQVGLVLAGLVVLAPGEGPDAALGQLSAHAVVKALLFLALGWLSVVTGGTLVRYVVGGGRTFSSIRRPLALGLLALAGVPPTVGFLSKEALLQQAEAGTATGTAGFLALGAVGASIPLTAAYCTRVWIVVRHGRAAPAISSRPGEQREGGPIIDDFFEEPEVVVEAAGLEEAESAISSTARLSVLVLALLSLLGGLLTLTPLLDLPLDLVADWRSAALSVGLVVAAALSVWAASRGVRVRDAALRLPRSLSRAAEQGLGADDAYRVLVVTPVLALARGVVWADREVVDAYVRASGSALRAGGQLGERATTRRPATALLVVLAGAVLVALLGVLLW